MNDGLKLLNIQFHGQSVFIQSNFQDNITSIACESYTNYAWKCARIKNVHDRSTLAVVPMIQNIYYNSDSIGLKIKPIREYNQFK